MGCDSTSALYGKGKSQIFKLLGKKELQGAINRFYDSAATNDEISSAENQISLALYGAGIPKKKKFLNDHRFFMFCRRASKINMKLTSLPPTEDAAKFHSLRDVLTGPIMAAEPQVTRTIWFVSYSIWIATNSYGAGSCASFFIENYNV